MKAERGIYSQLMKDNKIESVDFSPFRYDQQTTDKNYECINVKTIFMENELVFISPVIKQSKSHSLNILKTYGTHIWMLILATLLLLIIFNAFFEYNLILPPLKKLVSSAWVYFQPLISRGSGREPFNVFYLLWLISVLPLVEIFKNDLLANLVLQPEIYINDISDLLQDGQQTFAHSSKIKFWTQGLAQLNDSHLKEKLKLLSNKTNSFDKILNDVSSLDENEEHVQKLLKYSIISEENVINEIKPLLNVFSRWHVGENMFLPQLFSPFCYRRKFPYAHLANKMYKNKKIL